jgi:hypothetical protein
LIDQNKNAFMKKRKERGKVDHLANSRLKLCLSSVAPNPMKEMLPIKVVFELHPS